MSLALPRTKRPRCTNDSLPGRRTDNHGAHQHSLRRHSDRGTSRHTVSLVRPADSEAHTSTWDFEQVPRCVHDMLLIDGRSTNPADGRAARFSGQTRPAKQVQDRRRNDNARSPPRTADRRSPVPLTSPPQ